MWSLNSTPAYRDRSIMIMTAQSGLTRHTENLGEGVSSKGVSSTRMSCQVHFLIICLTNQHFLDAPFSLVGPPATMINVTYLISLPLHTNTSSCLG